jgi:hypothetical protein
LILSLNKKKEDGSPDYGNVIKFEVINFNNIYYAHDNPEIDLAYVNVSTIAETPAFIKFLDLLTMNL